MAPTLATVRLSRRWGTEFSARPLFGREDDVFAVEGEERVLEDGAVLVVLGGVGAEGGGELAGVGRGVGWGDAARRGAGSGCLRR